MEQQYQQDNHLILAKERVYTLSDNATTIARIDIPTSRVYRDQPALLYGARLTGTVAFTVIGGGDIGFNYRYLDNNIQSIIKQLRVLYGGQAIEDIQNYHAITHAVDDFTRSSADRYEDDVDRRANEYWPASIIDFTAETVFDAVAFNQCFTGADIYDSISLSFSIPIHCCIGDPTAPIPLHLFSQNDLQLEITLESPINAQVAGDNGNRFTTYSITNLGLDCTISRIPRAISDILFPGKTYEMHFQSFKHESIPVPAGSTSINEVVRSFKFSSLEQVFLWLINPASRNRAEKMFLGQRLKAGLSSLQVEFDGKLFPRRKIDTVSQMFSVVRDALAGSGIVNRAVYARDDHLTANDVTNAAASVPDYTLFKRFLGCINMQRYPSKSGLYTGTDNSANDNTDVRIMGDLSAATSEALELYIYARFSMTLQISNGQILILS